jgi:hypothetical protein
MGADWLDGYVSEKLQEIEQALTEIDNRLDADELHEARRRLVRMQAELMASLATFRAQPPNVN